MNVNWLRITAPIWHGVVIFVHCKPETGNYNFIIALSRVFHWLKQSDRHHKIVGVIQTGISDLLLNINSTSVSIVAGSFILLMVGFTGFEALWNIVCVCQSCVVVI